ncbi:MAG: carboxypeptidase-like regulatory domain-containing protein, partial [Candidatus Bathyarchaeota archaeon]
MRPSGDIGYGCFKVVSYVVLALMIVPLVIVPHSVCTSSTVQGVVQTIDGLPVADARVSLWEEDILLATTRTGSDGAFIFEGEFEGGYTVSVVGNLPETPGYDFVPARVGIRSGEEGVIKLRPGASVVLEGDVQFVETSYLPSSFQYSVLDPGTGEVMEVGGLSLIYGPSEDSLSQVLGLEA